MNDYLGPNIRTEGFRFDANGDVACYLIHGFTGSPFELEGLGKYLAENGITAVCDLLPGHGTSVEDCNTKTYQDWLDTVVAGYSKLESENKEVFIAAHSMGTSLAVCLANLYTLPAIVLYSSLFKFKSWKIYTTFLLAPFKDFLHKDTYYPRNSNLQFFGYRVYPLKATTQMIRLIHHARPLLRNITCPVLIMHSKSDATAPFRNGQFVYDSISSTDKRFLPFEKSSHMLTYDRDREKVWEETFKFFKEHSKKLKDEVPV